MSQDHPGESDAHAGRENPDDLGAGRENPDDLGAGRENPDDFDARLRAVERALTDADVPVAGLADDAAVTTRLEAVDDRLADVEDRVAELEAATQALRGYVGAVRAVNEEVERRADLALATARDARDDRHAQRPPNRETQDPGRASHAPDRMRSASDAEPTDGRMDGATRPDGDLQRSLPDDPAVAAAVPERDRPEHAGSDAAASEGWTWGRAALDRLRDAL